MLMVREVCVAPRLYACALTLECRQGPTQVAGSMLERCYAVLVVWLSTESAESRLVAEVRCRPIVLSR